MDIGIVILLLATIIVFTLGYWVGVAQGGIHITHVHPEKIIEKEPEKVEYNEVYLDNMDPQTRAYLEKNHGQLKL